MPKDRSVRSHRPSALRALRLFGSPAGGAFVALLLLVSLAQAAPSDWTLHRLVERDDFEAFDAASLNLYDFDGDGMPEIVSSNDNNRVYVIDLVKGRVLAEIATTHPEGWNARDINAVAIGDLYGDGVPCMVIPNSAAYLAAWCFSGRTLTGRFDFDKRWEIRVDAAQWEPAFHEERPWLKDQQPSMDGNAFLADVDGEPGLEIFVETDGYPGQFSFTHTGQHRWHTSWYDGNAGAVVADLDHDGTKEVVFASDSGVVVCYDANTGDERWTFKASDHGADPGSIPLAPLVANVAGDKDLELVFSARGATGGLEGSHATWFALDADGDVVWKRSYDWMNPLAYNHPAAIDVDDDGVLDVVALDWNTIGHKPGNWEPTERGPNLFALRGTDGGLLWRATVPAYWSNKDFVILGDSIVVNAAQDGRDGLATYDLATGSQRSFYALPAGWEAMRGPVAAQTEQGVFLVVPLAKPDPTPEREGLDVGDRLGALAILDARSGEPVRFSANFLHADGEAAALESNARMVPMPAWVALAAVGLAIAARRRR